MKKFKFEGYAKFPDHTVTDEDVYNFIKKHSRLIDRLNPKKMVDMTQSSFAILSDLEEAKKNEGDWKFFSRKK